MLVQNRVSARDFVNTQKKKRDGGGHTQKKRKKKKTNKVKIYYNKQAEHKRMADDQV